MSNIKHLPMPDRLIAEEVHLTIHNVDEKDKLWTLLKQIDFSQAMDVWIKPHESDRSLDQNNLVGKWYRDAEAQGDQTAEEYRAYCKLHFGVPIMRKGSERYKEKYDRLFKDRYTYEEKLEWMQEPGDYPVTRVMSVKQFAQFMDKVREHLEGLGFQLTNTDEMFR
jgi:C-terminal processing protease CtpA/Prc